MAFEINVDSYSYAAEPKKESGNYAAELAKKLVAEEAEARAYADKALKEQAETCFEEEAEKRRGADAALQEQINTEKVLRESKDMELEAALAAESSERQSSHQELNRSVSELGISMAAEISERDMGDKNLAESIKGLSEVKADKTHTHTAQEVGALPDNAEIPSKVSQLENDSGYLTEHQDISGKADKADTFTKNEVIAEIEGAVNSKAYWYYTKEEIDVLTGDIESALDGIIAIQNNLLGVSE